MSDLESTSQSQPKHPRPAEEAHLGVREVADGLVPHVVEEVLHAQTLELVHPHTIVVGELRLGPHQAHLHPTRL